MLHYVTFIFVLFVLIYKNDKQKHITTYHVTRMKTYICICYLNVLIAVLFTWCVFGCACVLLPRSHKRGMIVVKLMPNCRKINMFKPNSKIAWICYVLMLMWHHCHAIFSMTSVLSLAISLKWINYYFIGVWFLANNHHILIWLRSSPGLNSVMLCNLFVMARCQTYDCLLLTALQAISYHELLPHWGQCGFMQCAFYWSVVQKRLISLFYFVRILVKLIAWIQGSFYVCTWTTRDDVTL